MVALAVATVFCVVAGSFLGWRLADPATTDTAVGRVAFDIRASTGGEVHGYIPLAGWGFSADAIDGPLEIHAELRTLNREMIARAARGDSEVLSDAEGDIARGAVDALLRATAWALACTTLLLLVATALWRALRPRWILVAAGGLVAFLAHGVALGLTYWTFDEQALEKPTFFARGAELQRILEVTSGQPVTSEYGQTIADVLESVGLVLADARPAARVRGREIFTGSDLHLNPLVIEPTASFVEGKPLLLAGDFGQRGGPLETRTFAPQVAALSEPVVAVSGNHDTARLMGALENRGVEVLRTAGPGLDVRVVDGLRVAGFPDPLEWQGAGNPEDRPVTFDDLDDPDGAFDDALTELTTRLRCDLAPSGPTCGSPKRIRSSACQPSVRARRPETTHDRDWPRPPSTC